MVKELAVRYPCERCGARLYYHEQRERWCRQCAGTLGIERICDGGRTSWEPMFDPLAATERGQR